MARSYKAMMNPDPKSNKFQGGNNVENLKIIDVIAVFEGDKLRPLRFRFNGNTHRISKLHSSWISSQGAYKSYHFSVEDKHSNYFELGFDAARMIWLLEKSRTENGA